MTLDEAMKEIERLKGQVDVRDSVIAKLSGTVAEWRPLLTRAADALVIEIDLESPPHHISLIAELRKAADMTPQQSTCTGLLKLDNDGIWFCPTCGLRVSLPQKPKKRNRAKKHALFVPGP